ncbi:Ribonucleases P/MRP protein subunit POP1 [Yarrowia sp. B02]|nr:Ribonucleases P/MRP protein subunit POP1 [Yarrowia sp. B02]
MPPKKKSKLFNARRILVQNTDDALKDGRINVPAFVSARQREIEKLSAAMQSSRTASSQRAFQSLPRSLRRRAASHDVKRIPRKLRARARQEMSNDDPSCHTRALTGKNKISKLRGHDRLLAILERRKHIIGDRQKNATPMGLLQPKDVSAKDQAATPPVGKLRFEHRQKNKTWLPTHVWHAKRAHLQTRWGFSIPEKPSQKCYRKTHRGIKQEGATVWDSSYTATFRVEAASEYLAQLLSSWFGKKVLRKRYTSGEYCFTGEFKPEEVSLGPVQLLWESDSSVILRLHPCMTSMVLPLLNKLRLENAAHDFHYTDLRYAIGSIGIGGPKALQVLNTIFTPSDESSASAKMFRSLSHLATLDTLPENAVMHLRVLDPRLQPSKLKLPRTSNEKSIMETLVAWPGALVEENKTNTVFSEEARKESYAKQLSLKGINQYRTNKLRGEADGKIKAELPITIIRNGPNFSILLPWYWVLPVWFALVHIPCVSFVGYQQLCQIAYETGRPFFPNDYPQTEAGQAAEVFRGLELKQTYDRTPSAKRVSYYAELGNPFVCDWSLLKSENESDAELANSLKRVTIKYLHRGTPYDRARIFSIPEDKKQQWLDARKLDPENTGDYPLCPSGDHLIGFCGRHP